MSETGPGDWRERVADWITGGTLTTLRAEKSIAAQMLNRRMVTKMPWPEATLDVAETALPKLQAWAAGFGDLPEVRHMRAIEALAWDSLRRWRPLPGGEGQGPTS